MVDFSKFKIDNLKKMGSDLVDSVSSGDMLGKIKGSMGARGSLDVLPEDLKARVTSIDKKIEDITILQKTLNDALVALQKEAADLTKEAIAMYQPKPEPTTATPKKEEPKETGEK